MLKHIVIIKYKPDTPEAHIQRFVQQARDMFGQIPELLEIEVGRERHRKFLSTRRQPNT